MHCRHQRLDKRQPSAIEGLMCPERHRATCNCRCAVRWSHHAHSALIARTTTSPLLDRCPGFSMSIQQCTDVSDRVTDNRLSAHLRRQHAPIPLHRHSGVRRSHNTFRRSVFCTAGPHKCKCKCKCRFIGHYYVSPLMRYRLECPANRYVFKSRLNCSESTAGSLRQCRTHCPLNHDNAAVSGSQTAAETHLFGDHPVLLDKSTV